MKNLEKSIEKVDKYFTQNIDKYIIQNKKLNDMMNDFKKTQLYSSFLNPKPRKHMYIDGQKEDRSVTIYRDASFTLGGFTIISVIFLPFCISKYILI